MNSVLNVAAHSALFFVAKKREAQRFIIDARAANRLFQPPPSGPRTEPSRVLCSVTGDGIRRCPQRVHQMRIPAWLRSFLGLPFVFASEIGVAGQTIEEKRSVNHDSSDGFSCKDVTNEFTASGVADEPLRLSSNHALPPFLERPKRSSWIRGLPVVPCRQLRCGRALAALHRRRPQ